MARQHILAFRDIPGVVISGIQSRTRRRAEVLASEFGIPHVCESVAELFDKTGAENRSAATAYAFQKGLATNAVLHE